MRLIRWFQRFFECWKLARQIQRGTLVAITPTAPRDFVKTITAMAGGTIIVGEPVSLTDTNLVAPPAPEPVAPAPVEDVGAAFAFAPPPPGQFQVRRRHGDDAPEIIATSSDEQAMKHLWRTYAKNRGGWFTIELYDVKLNMVRGSR